MNQQTFRLSSNEKKKNAPMPPYSELRRIDGKEPAAAGHLTGRAAEMGEPIGEEDPEKASTR